GEGLLGNDERQTEDGRAVRCGDRITDVSRNSATRTGHRDFKQPDSSPGRPAVGRGRRHALQRLYLYCSCREVVSTGMKMPAVKGLLLLLGACTATCVGHYSGGVENENLPDEPRRERRLLIILIGGIDSDPTPEQIAGTAGRREGNSGLYRFAG